jgi:hypothetical protein
MVCSEKQKLGVERSRGGLNGVLGGAANGKSPTLKQRGQATTIARRAEGFSIEGTTQPKKETRH